jgi:peroxisomal 2,4-dienoyl-CoA reductase
MQACCGVQAVGFQGDVRKQEDAARVLASTVEHFGRLDILVNGAAGNFLASPEDLTPKGFRTGAPLNHIILVC